MQIEFTVSGLKPRQRRRREPSHAKLSVTPVVQTIVLAYQIEQAVRDGRARDYADVANQIGKTRARVSQVMRLLHLPPVLLERLLLDDPVLGGKLTERQLRPLFATSPSINQIEAIERLVSACDRGSGS